MIAPLAGKYPGTERSWQHRVTATIAHLETPEQLELCVGLLRAQTLRPYILVVDTGSSWETIARIEQLRSEDLEVHLVRGHSYRHSSEPVAIALDLAHARCHTPLMFHTHADVFARRLDLLESLAAMCDERTPVVGYRMTSRRWVTSEWEWMVGHSALMLHMPTMNAWSVCWSMQRAHDRHGMTWDSGKVGWPDTETGFNYDLRAAGIAPVFLDGQEENFRPYRDANIHHVRSYPGAKQYAPEHFARAQTWMAEAMAEARQLLA